MGHEGCNSGLIRFLPGLPLLFFYCHGRNIHKDEFDVGVFIDIQSIFERKWNHESIDRLFIFIDYKMFLMSNVK